MTKFEEWYTCRFGVHPNEVLSNSPAEAQARLAAQIWDSAYAEGHNDGYEKGYDEGRADLL